MKILNNKYYYFRVKRPNLTIVTPYGIKVSDIYINDTIMLNYKEMTDEQREFYLEHPSASVQEVWKCELNPPYVPPTPDLQEYIAQKANDLKDACHASVTVTALEYAMAEDKVNNLTADSYYTAIQANNVLKNFRSQSKKAMQVKDTYVHQIEAASTIEAIDTLYEQAIEALKS